MTDKRLYVVLVFAFLTLALVLGSITEMVK